MNVAVVCNCYRRLGFTRHCVPAAIASSGLPDAHWLLADDGSPDATGEFLLHLASKTVEVRVHAENKGHYVRRNEGFDWGLSLGADVVVLLDNDILTPQNWLRDLATAFLPSQFGIGTAWVCNDTTLCRMVGGAYGKPLHEVPPNVWVDTQGCGGACIAHKRKMLETGLRYTESFPLFCHGDAEFNGRCRNAGWKVGLYTGVQVYHLQPIVWADADYEQDKLKRRHIHRFGDNDGWKANVERHQGALIGKLKENSTDP